MSPCNVNNGRCGTQRPPVETVGKIMTVMNAWNKRVDQLSLTVIASEITFDQNGADKDARIKELEAELFTWRFVNKENRITDYDAAWDDLNVMSTASWVTFYARAMEAGVHSEENGRKRTVCLFLDTHKFKYGMIRHMARDEVRPPPWCATYVVCVFILQGSTIFFWSKPRRNKIEQVGPVLFFTG